MSGQLLKVARMGLHGSFTALATKGVGLVR
jgi:hypothetical protein